MTLHSAGTAAAKPAPAPVPEPTHPCVRCGRPVPLDVALCETCNPLGLEQPATSQVHGTVFVMLIVAVVLLAVVGRAALAGVGPFRADVVEVAARAPGLVVTIEAVNEGSKAGSTTCRLGRADGLGIGPSEVVLTPRIEAGERRQFTATTDRFGDTPTPLAITCGGQ